MQNEAQDAVTAGSEKAVRGEGISWKRLPPVMLLAALGGSVLNAIIYFVASGLGLIPQSVLVPAPGGEQPLTMALVSIGTVAGAIGAGMVFAVVGALAERPVRMLRIVAGVVLVLSFVGPLTIPGAPLSMIFSLEVMHVAAWVVIVGFLTTLARRPGLPLRDADDDRTRRNPLPAKEARARAASGTSTLGFFLLVFALSIPIWMIEPRGWRVTAAVGAPLVAALILVYTEEGLAGIRRLLRRVFDHKGIKPQLWYLPVIFLAPVIYLLTYGVTRLLGLPLPDNPHIPTLVFPLLLVLFFVLAIGEEVGWTGYVTDPLQERWSALTTSIVLGTVGATWHFVPLVQMGRTPAWIAWWTLGAVALRILTVWLYNNTGRSLFVAVVFHAMSNVSLAVFPNYGSHWDPAVAGAITAIAAVTVTFLWGPKTLARYRNADARHASARMLGGRS